MASTTNNISWGLIAFLISDISFIISSSIANLPAVSIMTRLKPFDFACAIAALEIETGSLFSGSL